MSYNFLRSARSITNSNLCRYDTLDGYSSDFNTNGDVDGWDIYNNIYLYGCWTGMVFGSAYDKSCYISRSTNILPVPAEDFYYVKIMMKVTNNNRDRVVKGVTTGRIQWVRVGDGVWDAIKQVDFDLIDDDQWHLYTINVGPYQWWQSYISNLRIYPFIDGNEGDQFAIKYIKISAPYKYTCSNTQCSYYLQYAHPCQGVGRHGSCEADISKQTYSITSGVNDELIVNIDGYGDSVFKLGTHENINGVDIAKIIVNSISSLNIGGYAYAVCEYSENDKLKITSGTVGSKSSVYISGTAAEELGFYSGGIDVSVRLGGLAPATGFDYASARLLTAKEIQRLIDENTEDFAYEHEPLQYTVEGGRTDFNEVGNARGVAGTTSRNVEQHGSSQSYVHGKYESVEGSESTLIDYSHPINNNGKLKAIYFYGKPYPGAKAKVLRPSKDGSLTVLYTFDFHVGEYNPSIPGGYLYTVMPLSNRVDCDVLVNMGDLIGIYNADVYVGATRSNKPDATFAKIDGEAYGSFTPDTVVADGVAGLAIYARGDRLQTNTILDIDLGDKVNIEEVNIYGYEPDGEVEFNIASCLDVTWEVNLFGGSHNHTGVDIWTMFGWTHTHLNLYYGKECLDDGIRTADGGQVGTSYGTSGGNGLWTAGPPGSYSYFYVNGDTEWLYAWTCGKTEYCRYMSPSSTYNYIYDPVEFTLTFPHNLKIDVHKSILYFKENINFRGMSLSTYLGPLDNTGNDPRNKHYLLVPSYDYIKLDGITYLDDDSIVSNYLFNNPMSSRPLYTTSTIDGRPSRPSNHLAVRGSLMTYWNVIEHEFDPISCYGFRVFTDHHESTKITEMEVYTKIQTYPSLIDNVSLSFTDYGEVWGEVAFEEVSPNKISGFVGGGPRYFRLELESTTFFSLNEIEFSTGDQVKLEDCSDSLFLLDAPGEKVSSSTPIEVENVYGMPFDLYVDIPRESIELDNLIFWSKLGSDSEITSPEIGPSCVLSKSPDFIIKGDEGQIAVNTDAYGLMNMVDGKKSYYSYTSGDDWDYYDTLSSGVSVVFSQEDITFKDHEFSFNIVSSYYWQFAFYGAYTHALKILGDSVWQRIYDFERVYSRFIKDDVSSSYLTMNWSKEVDLIGDDSILYYDYVMASSYGSGGSSGEWRGPFVDSEINVTNFTCDFDFIFYRSANSRRGTLSVIFYDSDDINRISFRASVDSTSNDNIRVFIERNGVNVYEETNPSGLYNDETNKNNVIINRVGNTLNVWLNGNLFFSGPTETHLLSRVRIKLDRHVGYTVPDILAVYFKDTTYKGCEVVRFNYNGAIDRCLIRTHALYRMLEAEVYTSSDGVNYNLWAGNNFGIVAPYFDGGSSNISLPTGNYGSGKFTVEFWSNPENNNVGNYVDSNYVIDFESGRFIIGSKNSNAMRWCIYDGSWRSFGSLDVGVWQHVAMTFDSDINEAVLYLDGDYVSTIYFSGVSMNGTVRIGSQYSNGARYNYKGYLVDFRVWGGIRTQSQIKNNRKKRLSGTESGLLFYYPMNEYSGATYYDITGGRDGTGSSLTRSYIADIFEEVINALEFDYRNNTFYDYFAIDLEKRHSLDIIRNYGTSSNKLWLSVSDDNISYSNSYTNVVEDVVWGNSNKDDARWLRIRLLSGDETVRYIDKLGIYPNISSTYCIDGGYNCNWHPLGNILSDYSPSINVAYGSDATTNNYFANWYPINVVNGITNQHNYDECWGFEKINSVDPYIDIDFGQLYVIDKIFLYHGLGEGITDYMNVDYNFKYRKSSEEDWTDLFSISGNDEFYRTHYFNGQEMKELRMTITAYTSKRVFITNPDGSRDAFNGSFLREIEVYNMGGIGYVDSETWPVVCINLNDQFNIFGHDLLNKDPNDTDTDWDNDDQFFKYSDSISDDPRKVTFTDTSAGLVTQFFSMDSSGNMKDSSDEYLFGSNIYFDAIRYHVSLDTYYLEYDGEISLRLDGPQRIDFFPEAVGTAGWKSQSGYIDVPEAGFYDVKAIQHISVGYNWGMRYPHVYRFGGLVKWAAVNRDTAEGYSYDNDPSKYGEDYLDKIRIYADEEIHPLEYYWGWDSNLSELSNDYLNTVVRPKSLRIDYPTSSSVDTLSFGEYDNFGVDDKFNVKDTLHFYWRISDVNAMDLEFGDILFGTLYDAAPAYYVWNISSLSLNTGWNNINLKFEDADSFYPTSTGYLIDRSALDSSLDFRTNNKKFSSMRIRYRGKGNAFSMHLDDLKISRGKFETAKFDRGLCLTGEDYLEIPLSSVNLTRGTIEFWLKLYTDTYGRDIFDHMNSRVLFTLINNNNFLISLGIKSANWFQPVVGHIRKALNLFNISSMDLPLDMFFDRGSLVHVAMVWSCDGSGTDNSDTVRLYINNTLVCSSNVVWEIGDTKSSVLRLGGATTRMAHNQDSYGSAIFDNVKIYNYCKDNFNIEMEGLEKDVSYNPNEFMQISKDNLTFHSIGSSELPLVYESVPPGEKRIVYIRTNKDERFINSRKTADLLVQWIISV